MSRWKKKHELGIQILILVAFLMTPKNGRSRTNSAVLEGCNVLRYARVNGPIQSQSIVVFGQKRDPLARRFPRFFRDLSASEIAQNMIHSLCALKNGIT